MNYETTMHARDAVSAKLASLYLLKGNERYLLIQAKSFEAKIEKDKKEIGILGRSMKGNKASGAKGTGSFTIYQNTPLFTDMLKMQSATGTDVYFDLMVVNEDPTSEAGRQIVTFKDVNLNGGTIASFDADGEMLEQAMDFTFEGMEIIEKFQMLPGMKQ